MKSPLSHSSKCTFLQSIDVHSLSLRWLSELDIEWVPPAETQVIRYWRDDETGLYFYTPSNVAGDGNLYSKLQQLPWYYMDDKWEFTVALSILKKLSSDSRILEIGVGQGAFLRKASAVFPSVCGLELNPLAAKAARMQGFTIMEENMSALYHDNKDAWDAICAFQVLEHLPEPREFLEDAIALLRLGGLLILSVPNAAVSRQIDPGRHSLLDQPPHHMTHWDESVFRSIENFLPLSLRHVAFEPLASYHISWFVDAWTQPISTNLGQLGGRLVYNRITKPLLKTALGLGLRKFVRGHTLLVCFEKIQA